MANKIVHYQPDIPLVVLYMRIKVVYARLVASYMPLFQQNPLKFPVLVDDVPAIVSAVFCSPARHGLDGIDREGDAYAQRFRHAETFGVIHA